MIDTQAVKKVKAKYINMNLAGPYPPDWGVREAVREEIRWLQDELATPCEVIFVGNMDAVTMGVAEIKQGRRDVFINDKLLEPGKRTARIMTLCHEIAHISSEQGDATLDFEDTLGDMLGKMAEKAMGR